MDSSVAAPGVAHCTTGIRSKGEMPCMHQGVEMFQIRHSGLGKGASVIAATVFFGRWCRRRRTAAAVTAVPSLVDMSVASEIDLAAAWFRCDGGRPAAPASSRSLSARCLKVPRQALQPFAIEPINAYMAEMKSTAVSLVCTGRCILDVGESKAKLAPRLRKAGAPAGDLADGPGIVDDESLCHAWLEVLLGAEGIDECFSGVVLAPEALPLGGSNGKVWVETLKAGGVLPGVRIYTGFFPLNGYGELGTDGAINLAERCQEYYSRGVRFAQWRTSLACSMELPTDIAVWECTARLAEVARICQASGLVPVIEVEFKRFPGTQSAERCAFVSEKFFSLALQQLSDQDVNPEALVFTVSPCQPGLDAPPPIPSDVGDFTARSLWRTFPPALPGVQLLAGGLAADEAARILVAMRNALPQSPWGLALAFDETLQAPVLARWAADGETIPAREAFLGLARLARHCATAPTTVDV